MKPIESKSLFQPQSPDAAGVISWIHLGDLHMTKAGEQNHLDPAEIVDEVNRALPTRRALSSCHDVTMQRVGKSDVWEANVTVLNEGVYPLVVEAEDQHDTIVADEFRVVIGDPAERERAERDQDNALEAWAEHGLLGTQLGPNKNGKKW